MLCSKRTASPFHSRGCALLACLLVSMLVPVLALANPVEFQEAIFDGVNGVDGLEGPRFLALSPDGAHLYAASENSNSVAVFTRQMDGNLVFVEAVVDGVGGVDGLGGADAVAVSPDGAHVYVGSAVEAAVAVFARDPGSGTLTFIEAHFDGVGGVEGLASTVWISVSPDGANVYSSGFSDNAIAVFTRNAATGSLSFVEAEVAGGALTTAHGHVLSPDGAHLYATSLVTGTLVVLARDGINGALSLVETQVNGVGGVTGMALPRGITISPDGRHVYTSSLSDSSVAIFERDQVAGTLTFLDAVSTALDRATSANFEASGRFLYVTSFGNNGLTIFERDADSGGLHVVDLERQGVDGVDGMDGPLIALPTPDGSSVYVQAFFGNSLAVFRGAPEVNVPTLALPGLAALAALLAGLGWGILRRRG